VCHSLDDGLTEDPDNQNNQCGACSKAKSAPAPSAVAPKPPASSRGTRRKRAAAS
jgi:hypothetical protein